MIIAVESPLVETRESVVEALESVADEYNEDVEIVESDLPQNGVGDVTIYISEDGEAPYDNCDPNFRNLRGDFPIAHLRRVASNTLRAQLDPLEDTPTGGATRTYADRVTEKDS